MAPTSSSDNVVFIPPIPPLRSASNTEYGNTPPFVFDDSCSEDSTSLCGFSPPLSLSEIGFDFLIIRCFLSFLAYGAATQSRLLGSTKLTKLPCLCKLFEVRDLHSSQSELPPVPPQC